MLTRPIAIIGWIEPPVGSSSSIKRPAGSARCRLTKKSPIPTTCRNPPCAYWLEVCMPPNVNYLEHWCNSCPEEPSCHDNNHCCRPMSTQCVCPKTHSTGTPGSIEMLHHPSKTIVVCWGIRKENYNCVHVTGQTIVLEMGGELETDHSTTTTPCWEVKTGCPFCTSICLKE